MENIWERFEGIATLEDVTEAKENTFEKPTAGVHKVVLLSAEPRETQSGIPAVRFKMKDVDTNKLISHQLLLQNINYPENTARNIVQAINFFNNFTDDKIVYTTMSELANDFMNTSHDEVCELEVSYKEPTSKYADMYITGRVTDSLPY